MDNSGFVSRRRFDLIDLAAPGLLAQEPSDPAAFAIQAPALLDVDNGLVAPIGPPH